MHRIISLRVMPQDEGLVTLRFSKSEMWYARYKIMVRVPHHDIVFLNVITVKKQ